jgi:hypothetical protein
VEPTAEFSQLQLGFVDQTQRRYEVIRPLVLFADRTAAQRARETQTHPDTVRKLQRRFQHQGMLGLLPIAGYSTARPVVWCCAGESPRGSCVVCRHHRSAGQSAPWETSPLRAIHVFTGAPMYTPHGMCLDNSRHNSCLTDPGALRAPTAREHHTRSIFT